MDFALLTYKGRYPINPNIVPDAISVLELKCLHHPKIVDDSPHQVFKDTET